MSMMAVMPLFQWWETHLKKKGIDTAPVEGEELGTTRKLIPQVPRELVLEGEMEDAQEVQEAMRQKIQAPVAEEVVVLKIPLLQMEVKGLMEW